MTCPKKLCTPSIMKKTHQMCIFLSVTKRCFTVSAHMTRSRQVNPVEVEMSADNNYNSKATSAILRLRSYSLFCLLFKSYVCF